jgi:hypothetical protein
MAIDGSAAEPADDNKAHASRMRQHARAPRYPENGAWPAEMRIDMLAAYLDFRNVEELVRAISKGCAPAPTSCRTRGRSREPIWSKVIVDEYVARACAIRQNRLLTDLAALV